MPFSQLTMPTLPARVRRSSHIAGVIQEMIADGRLQPGDRLPTECQLCEQFGVSRTTLREAVQMLRSNGLLDVTPGRGSFIRSPDVDSCLNNLLMAVQARGLASPGCLLMARRLLQGHAARLLAQAATDKVQAIQQHTLARHADAASNAASLERWQLAMMDAGGNPLLSLMLKTLLAANHRQRCTRLENIDNVMSTIHGQLRVHALLASRDWDSVERVLLKMVEDEMAPAAHTGLQAQAA